MKISVITAVYNNAGGIKEAIDSIQSQKDVDIEIVVVDGGSSDGTVEILEGYRDRIDIFVSEPDEGIYDALNKGLRLARGDVVGFLHSDDAFADARALARVAAAFADSPAIDAVYGDLKYVSRNDAHRTVRHWRAGPFSAAEVARGWMPPHPTLYCRRSVVQELGEYDVGLAIAADYEWMLRLMRSGRSLAYIPEVQVSMRMGGASNRSLGNIVRKSSEDWIALRRHGWTRLGALMTLAAKNLRKLPQFIGTGKETV